MASVGSGNAAPGSTGTMEDGEIMWIYIAKADRDKPEWITGRRPWVVVARWLP